MDPTVAAQFSAQLIAGSQTAIRHHDSFMAMMDRTFLTALTSSQDSSSDRLAELNASSHAPQPQPWAAPVRGS